MEKKTSEAKKKLLLRPSWKNQSLNRRINLQTKSSDLMAALQNPATLMISGANSQQVCFELKSPALLIKGGTCPADELLLYQIPMDEDDSWLLGGCCFTTHKKKLSKPSPNHCRCSGLRMQLRLHLHPMPTSRLPRKFCR